MGHRPPRFRRARARCVDWSGHEPRRDPPPRGRRRLLLPLPSIARLIVRRLVRDAIPGASAEDIVTARCNYARLDEAGSPVSIRPNSTVVRIGHVGNPATAREVEVAYIRGGKLRSVRWHTMVPFICPELPSAQRSDLATATKVPILYTNVVLRDWHAFVKAGTNAIHSPVVSTRR